MAYVAAWLRVAGGNSVLPAWVRHRFPETVQALRQIRDRACADPACVYCGRMHDSAAHLQRWFGFSGFRARPAGPDGKSLQAAIVAAGLRDQPLLAILPTGGGKSLCFQLPALARYERRGLLTVVVSPLQALMKDQVDNLQEKTGSQAAAALYGMLTAPERGDVLERVRLGGIGLLYVSPEQLRNPSFRSTIKQREIGCWVFDEAHCLSKWGHDFRPDYLYASRFIRELATEQRTPVPPVACFTATAKRDVVAEIRTHFSREIDQTLELFDSNVARDNLRFMVEPVTVAEKFTRVGELLKQRLPADNSAIVYTSTRKHAEQMADHLAQSGWAAAAFHAGLEPQRKRDIQERFVSGQLQVIAATNAFGMGIDKDNVRLVIHADMPGSLENYLQEAGRAGRDQRQSDCVLLFCEEDVERQFSMTSFGQISRRDIAQILRGLRRTRRPKDRLVITTGELLRSDEVDIELVEGDRGADTRVKMAIAWLENAGFVRRNENANCVWQGQILAASMIEAEAALRELSLPERKRRHCLALLARLISHRRHEPHEVLSADELMALPELADADEADDGVADSRYALRLLHDMEEAGLIKQSAMLTALVRHKVESPSTKRLSDAAALQRAMLKVMQEAAPDADEERWQVLSLRELNQRLSLEVGSTTSIRQLQNLLKQMKTDGRPFGEGYGSLEIRQAERDKLRVKLRRPWTAIREFAELRLSAMTVALDAIVAKITDASVRGADLLVEFSVEDLLAALREDMYLGGRIRDGLDLVGRCLVGLHDLRVIVMQQGMGIFRQAMTLDLLPEAKGRRYTRGDFAPLRLHYDEQIMQIHVMAEYASRAIDDVPEALRLVGAYFTLDREDFVRRYFAGRERMLERAVGQDAFRRIVDDLDQGHGVRQRPCPGRGLVHRDRRCPSRGGAAGVLRGHDPGPTVAEFVRDLG